MRKAPLALMCLAPILWWSMKLAAQASGADPGRLLALENAWSQAVRTKDAKALRSLLGPELFYVDYDGAVMNREGYVARVTSPSVLPQQVVSEAMVVHFYGAVAVVNGVYRETGMKNAKRYKIRERFTDTWVLQASGSWMCVGSISTLIQ